MNRWLLGKMIGAAITYPRKELYDYGMYYSPYYSLMYYLAHSIDNGIAVELGVESGRGINALSLGNPDLKVVGIDTTDVCSEIVESRPNITFLHLPSLPPPEGVMDISLLHIDTEHSYAMAQAEFNAYQPLLLPGAVVLFDDTHAMDDGVKQFVDTLPYYKIYEDRLHPICGYAVVLYEP